MKSKNIKSFGEFNENLNISDVSDSDISDVSDSDISDVSESKKEKCWVIRSSEGNIMWVHKTMNDEQLKDYRRQGLYIEEHMLLD